MATATTTTKKARNQTLWSEGTTNSSARDTDGNQKATDKGSVAHKRRNDKDERDSEQHPSPGSENFRNTERGAGRFTVPPVRSPGAGTVRGSPTRSADEVKSNASRGSQGSATRQFLVPKTPREEESPARQVELKFGAAPYVSMPMGTPGLGIRAGRGHNSGNSG